MEVIFYRTDAGQAGVIYGEATPPIDTAYYTIKNISGEEVENIRNISYEHVQELLSHYI